MQSSVRQGLGNKHGRSVSDVLLDDNHLTVRLNFHSGGCCALGPGPRLSWAPTFAFPTGRRLRVRRLLVGAVLLWLLFGSAPCCSPAPAVVRRAPFLGAVLLARRLLLLFCWCRLCVLRVFPFGPGCRLGGVRVAGLRVTGAGSACRPVCVVSVAFAGGVALVGTR